MKRISFILLAGTLLLLGSCKKYLNTVPDDVLTIDEIFASKQNTDNYMASIYQQLPNELMQRFGENYGLETDNSGPWEASSDDAKYNWDFNYSNSMNASVWSNTDVNVNTYWKNYYQAIRNATDFINRIDGATSEITTSQKRIYKGEARGLRAIFYFYLLRTYGPVVLIGNNLIPVDASTDAIRLPRTPFDKCISFVVNQLDSAYLDVPLTPSSKQYGRITKGIVKAYKAEALLLDASPLYNGNTDYASLKNADGTQLISQTYDVNKWKNAADAAKAFIDEFVPVTYDLFTESDPDPFVAAYLACRDVMLVDWNKEWIFARSNSGSYMRYDRTPKHVGVAPSDQQGAGAMGVTQTMVDAYFMANGRTIDDAQSGYVTNGFTDYQAPFDVQARSTYNQWVNREPRFYVGVTYNNSYWLYQDNGSNAIISNMEYSGNSGRSQSTSDVSPTGYIVRKNVPSGDDSRGALLLRLANIYLDYAEALNEYDPTNADILKYLNLIRLRAGVPQYGAGVNALPVPSGQDAMRAAIRQERRVELAFENTRYFDTRRWKIAQQTDAGPFYGMNMYKDGADFYKKTLLETRVFQKRDYLFPIPNNEVLKNNLLVQNPGW